MLVIGLAILLAGCGGGSSSKQGGITVQPAREYQLDQLRIVRPIVGSRPCSRSGSSSPTAHRSRRTSTAQGPHTGVHLILIRRDLSTIVHRHPVIKPDGSFSESITFAAPGPYRIVVDAYPAHATQTNFQLFSAITVAGSYRPAPLPPLQRAETIDGYRFALQTVPHLRAIEPGVLALHRDGARRQARVVHAVVRSARARDLLPQGLARLLPHARLRTGSVGVHERARQHEDHGDVGDTGKLTVGVLVPLAGTWRLFLQCQVDGRVITAPFTLVVT